MNWNHTILRQHTMSMTVCNITDIRALELWFCLVLEIREITGTWTLKALQYVFLLVTLASVISEVCLGPWNLEWITWRDHANFREQFVMCRLGLAMINLHTKFEVPTMSKYWSKGGWVTLSANFRVMGRRPPTTVGVRKLESTAVLKRLTRLAMYIHLNKPL